MEENFVAFSDNGIIPCARADCHVRAGVINRISTRAARDYRVVAFIGDSIITFAAVDYRAYGVVGNGVATVAAVYRRPFKNVADRAAARRKINHNIWQFNRAVGRVDDIKLIEIERARQRNCITADRKIKIRAV